MGDDEDWSQGALRARPDGGGPAAPRRAGVVPLGLARGRDGLLLVPEPPRPDARLPLLVMLHGAGGTGAGVLPIVEAEARRHAVLVAAPDARGGTWDVIRGGLGPDVEFIDGMLDQAFARHLVDPARVAVGGFSDGASYALTLGLANGDLFGDVLAFSPGFMAPARVVGAPRVFLSHGVRDAVLPIDRCGRRLAVMLRRGGYGLDYREFDGGHVVPPDMVAAAFEQLLEERR